LRGNLAGTAVIRNAVFLQNVSGAAMRFFTNVPAAGSSRINFELIR
jgi:hypothetical protein